MRDHELRKTVKEMENKINKLTKSLSENCSYCMELFPKGTCLKTGEYDCTKVCWFQIFNDIKTVEKIACPKCLEDMKSKCKAVKTALSNKVKKEK